jgi:N-acetylglucosaminyldiphosphoundecaprenol N-acetyl-beta-D-mannosaminyltransferase
LIVACETVNILGVNIHALRVSELHHEIDNIIKFNSHALILNVNINCLNLALRYSWMRDLLNRAEIVFCDGTGVILGAKILGYTIYERITYADWFWQLAEFAESRKFSFFFLGGRPGIPEKAAAILKDRFPNIRIVGAYHGYFDKSLGSSQNEAIIERINEEKPNILVIGFGMPLQERWLLENWERIDANIALTGGAVFDYVSGSLVRAPRWMTENGLEWLGRLLVEPRRLWSRYLLGNPLFFWRVLQQRYGLLNIDGNSISNNPRER